MEAPAQLHSTEDKQKQMMEDIPKKLPPSIQIHAVKSDVSSTENDYATSKMPHPPQVLLNYETNLSQVEAFTLFPD